ncbi:MAG: cytochrome c [Gammaproteobacteria bacterium]|nr:cytochrome c [Gammaproteobacteria bacterium]MDH3535166.1 cytochrome c [Gammaproteobacteria bacterium]
MKNLSIYVIGISLLMPIITAPAIASEDIDIPFHLGKGQLLYEKYCSSCHGLQLNGSDKGPPLIHPFYKPSHHGDKSFYRAVLQGVKQHHWNFGDMPAVAGMTPKKMDSLVPYVRYYQQQKNLF